MADLVTYHELLQFIPEVTEYRFKIARLHIKRYGRGTPLPENKSPRMKVDETQLDHFLTFITSSHVVQDLPFGQRYIRLSNGEVLETPNVIRNMIPQRIIEQYTQFCSETGVKPMSPSTLRRILTVCSASVRKSLQGLDYFAADGGKAFDDLSEVVNKLQGYGYDSEWVDYCKGSLKKGKSYIKTDYKVHITNSDRVRDHCCNYALSDPKDTQLSSTCDHDHDLVCASCEDLKSLLASIESTVTKADEKLGNVERDDLLFTCKQAIQAIHNWKAHQLRSIRQDTARMDVIELLDEKMVFITQDWAMKCLPHKYRETQADWFGKRGISWHISVVVRRSEAGSLETQAFIHIAKNCSQDGDDVVTIMDHTLRQLKREHPEISEAVYRQDNAACYHGATMITACSKMKQLTGIAVKRVDFSDPQGGKGACDRKAASVKADVRRYINEGHDVVTAVDLRDAILSHGGLRGVRVCLLDLAASRTSQAMVISNISLMNNFHNTGKKLKMWRAYGIGDGKSLEWSKSPEAKSMTLHQVDSAVSDGDFTKIALTKEKVHKDETPQMKDDPNNDNRGDYDQPPLFNCPNDGCVKLFQRYSSLENHLSCGKCELVEEKHNLLDKAKLLYREKLLHGSSNVPSISSSTTPASTEANSVQKGWALKSCKQAKRFNDKQKAYLDSKFKIGQETGYKLDGVSVSRDMRCAKDELGNRLFSADEFLTAQQIASYFSRMSARIKKGQPTATSPTKEGPTLMEDIEDENESFLAAEDENAFISSREQVLKECQLVHPLRYDTYNICELARSDRLKKFNVAMLRDICEYFDLKECKGVKGHRKDPYIRLIKDVVANCSCSA